VQIKRPLKTISEPHLKEEELKIKDDLKEEEE